MNQLVNYKLTNNKKEEFVEVKLLLDREVLLEIPMCIVPFGTVIEKAFINSTVDTLQKALNETEVNEHLQKTRTFNLKIIENSFIEDNEAYDIQVRLPIDTKVNELIYEDGQILWAKPIEKKGDIKHGNI